MCSVYKSRLSTLVINQVTPSPLRHGPAVVDGVLPAGELAAVKDDVVRDLGGGVWLEPHDERLAVRVQLVRRAQVRLL